MKEEKKMEEKKIADAIFFSLIFFSRDIVAWRHRLTEVSILDSCIAKAVALSKENLFGIFWEALKFLLDKSLWRQNILLFLKYVKCANIQGTGFSYRNTLYRKELEKMEAFSAIDDFLYITHQLTYNSGAI
jgi:hypothetical protein